MAEIRWLNAVIDIPAEHFDTVGDLWAELTNSTKGEVHPDHTEFVHLLPESGDMHLELQRIDHGPAGAHLDLVVDDIPAVTERAVSLGATVVARPGHAVLKTPGGVPFCIVPAGAESERAPVIDHATPHAADQICLDVPHEHFETDIAFWSELTGWAVNEPKIEEFRSFAQPSGLPLRILIQRLGIDDTRGPRSHMDISCGKHTSQVAAAHLRAGATVVDQRTHWTALRDIAGMDYCLTQRSPSKPS